MTDLKGSTSKGVHTRHKEWDEISCPICMEHPHNAVLLICSSHEKGCRSYICDTSYRHSNCLDRFRKMRENLAQPGSSLHDNFDTDSSGQRNSIVPDTSYGGPRMGRNLVEAHEDYSLEANNDEILQGLFEAMEDNNHNQPQDSFSGAHAEERINHGESAQEKSLELNCMKCPLCRGTVTGWTIVKEARQYWDLKPRSCSRESCSFSGNYRELRKHARGVHPAARPGDVDPMRQHAWRRLQHQQEHDDIISAIRSAMPGAIVFGDYVLDSRDGRSHDRESPENVVFGEANRPLWTTFFLFHMIGSPIRVLEELAGSPRPRRRRRRPSRNLWGENLLGLPYDEDDNDDDDESPEDDDFLMPRRRRRMTRSNSDEDHS